MVEEITNLKEGLKGAILHSLSIQIQETNDVIKRAVESKLLETKSTAGDKFETSRAMLQKEQDMNESRLMQLKTLHAKMLALNVNKSFSKVEWGSLVLTNKGTFFLCIGMGKLKYLDETYFIVSPQAPIVKNFIGKSKGDDFVFNGRCYEITDMG